MTRRQFEEEVRWRLRDRPYLLPVFHDTLDIAGRLREILPELFVVWNASAHRYEVHSLAHKVDTLGLIVTYPQLDHRTLDMVRQYSLRHRGRAIFREVEASQEVYQRRRAREFRNWVRDVAEETRTAFAKLAWS